MFDEISTEGAEYLAPQPPQSSAPSITQKFEDIVADVMQIEQQQVDAYQPIMVMTFRGQLRIPSNDAFEVLDQQLAPLDYRAQMTTDSSNSEYPHLISVIQGRFSPEPRPTWVNGLLLLLTILTTMWAGAQLDGESNLLKGLPYSLSVMLILGAHEMGHYFAARYHQVNVTLPYFIPLPPIIGFFGTLGAFIQIREPMKNRKQLFDIGIAGPLAGLVFAVPILILGVATAEVTPLPTAEDCPEGQICYILEGNSLLYAFTKFVVHGEWLPSDTDDMNLNQLAFAGWTGLFVTGLNLLPVGQLDGGHVLYTLLGNMARKLYYPILILMLLLTINNTGWLLWMLLLVMFGRIYAVPQDDITPLDPTRRILGVFTLLVFVFVFVPSPITLVSF